MEMSNRSMIDAEKVGRTVNITCSLWLDPQPQGDKFACKNCHPFTVDKCFSCLDARLMVISIVDGIKPAVGDSQGSNIPDDTLTVLEEIGLGEIEIDVAE